MELRLVEEGGVSFVEGEPDRPFMSRIDDVNRLIEACLSNHFCPAVLYARNLTETFFDVSSGDAGVLLQKLRNYHIKLAVVCPPDSVRFSARFGELLNAERRDSHFSVFENRDAAVAWLSEASAE
jgi:hypothetical protein